MLVDSFVKLENKYVIFDKKINRIIGILEKQEHNNTQGELSITLKEKTHISEIMHLFSLMLEGLAYNDDVREYSIFYNYDAWE